MHKNILKKTLEDLVLVCNVMRFTLTYTCDNIMIYI